MKTNQRNTVALCALFLLVACNDAADVNGSRAMGDAAINVVTAKIIYRPLVDEIEALGTASANESIDIQPRVASLIESIEFVEGQLVKKGDLLVKLESSETKAGLALAEAALAESRSLYNRNKALSDTHAISASGLEQLLAQVKVDEAQVEAARARLDNTLIRAPFAGRVGLRRVSPGSFVNTSTVITTLDDISTIKLDFSVPETFLTVVKDGMTIRAGSIVYPNRRFAGTVASIDTRLDPVTRAVQVRAILPNVDGDLKPGMFMTVELQRDRGDVLVAPEQSIVPEGDKQYVFVVADNVVEKRTVELGRRVPGYVVITTGLVEGEEVITEGTGKVRSGSEVNASGAAARETRDSAAGGDVSYADF
ncbi:MAG TPA: efflux RND transporter periplasmic adaptor subunit [Woeseiaceae bacterium]|nr:efflux RND transporter periplasmic adaptor subunit [Woeseiaceae bacterium]